jgi:hypothetical protein
MQEALSLLLSLGEPYTQHPTPHQLLSTVNTAVSYAEAGRASGMEEAAASRAAGDMEGQDPASFPSLCAGD